MSASKYIKKAFHDTYSGKNEELKRYYKQKLVQWRKTPTIIRAEKPTNPVRARSLGYKAKQGFVIARVRIPRSGKYKTRHTRGRKHSKSGVNKFKPGKSYQRISEERSQRRYPNMEVLNSYWVGEDGLYKWFEIILVDPAHPAIINDININWIMTQKNRAARGQTGAGKRGSKFRRETNE